jgi:hypothetical protein
MARRRQSRDSADWLFPNLTTTAEGDEQSSLVDVLDNVLNRGVVVTGDLVLGVANVDLIYLKLSALLAALDRITENDPVFRPVAAGPARKRLRRKPERKGRRRG